MQNNNLKEIEKVLKESIGIATDHAQAYRCIRDMLSKLNQWIALLKADKPGDVIHYYNAIEMRLSELEDEQQDIKEKQLENK